jgi:hypothetical protein
LLALLISVESKDWLTYGSSTIGSGVVVGAQVGTPITLDAKHERTKNRAAAMVVMMKSQMPKLGNI